MAARVIGIFTAPAEGGPIEPREAVQALAGRGLDGDRHCAAVGSDHQPAEEITLISAEGLRRAATMHGVELAPGEHRRNIVTDGADLLALVGRTVRVGEVEIDVLEDNPPCRHLQDLTGKPMVRALRGHGGVRGRITTSGTIRVGDAVEAVEPVEVAEAVDPR